ncbi:MAG: exodeoxyribonuclease small subunit [Bacteriovoracaceae bacterium]|nr:exodeoxyribonuclease small subunit [Bacteriovoracaceae bacterium]
MAKKLKELPENLEEALKALEEAVEKLEEPDLPLEESIELFEWGTKLSDVCYARLKDAEKKVEILVKKVPNPQSREDFESEEFEPHENS